MHFVEYLAQKTAEYKVGKMNGDYSETEEIISQFKNTQVTLDKQDIIDIQKYALFAIYSELFVLLITLGLSLILNIFFETLIIIISFTFFRRMLKGEHLHSFNKCSILTTFLLMICGVSAKTLVPESYHILPKVVIYIIIGFGLELFAISKIFNKVLTKIDDIKIGGKYE